MHGDYPPVSEYIRTHQYLSGYFLRPYDSNQKYTKFHVRIYDK